MKKTGILVKGVLLGLLLLSFTVTEGPFDSVVKAIKDGNVKELIKYADNTIQITLQEKANSYSKAQGEVILKEFFTRNKVQSFDIIHQGGEESKFGIGKLVTSGGSYRTTFFLRQKGNTYVLQEIRFEAE
jgi:hypothetical protein